MQEAVIMMASSTLIVVMPVLYWDIETRSIASLEDAGAWRYAADPSTEALCVGYAVEHAEPRIWIPGEPVPAEFIEAASNPDWLVVAHNYQFERAIATRILEPRFGWPVIPLDRQRCTMSLALANALPGALDSATQALSLEYQKDATGYLLMRRMARPRRPWKGEDRSALHWVDGAEQRDRLHLYCKRDVEAERALYHRLRLLSPSEQALWELDAVINARGFHVDVDLARAARDVARIEQARVDVEIAELTDHEITSVNQVAKIVAFVRRHGHSLESLTKRSVSVVLAHDPDADVRQLLDVRQLGARASTRKFDALLASVDLDNRLRGTLRYHSASTGRWSGQRFQPQNLKKQEVTDLDAAVTAVMASDIESIRELGAPLTIAGDTARAIICSAPNHVLIGADFSAIESRVLAWLAGEDWKLETYRKYDETGDATLEPYCAGASQILKRTVTPGDAAGRAIGKVCDLAFGYGGGRGAWRKFDTSDTYSDAEVEDFKHAWRRTHAKTVRLWRALEKAAHRAVRTGASVNLANGKVSFVMEGGALFMSLPSGRRLAYPRGVPGRWEV
jgi:DNA polymerase bacteriophage-type